MVAARLKGSSPARRLLLDRQIARNPYSKPENYMPATIPMVSVVNLGFDDLARSSDDEVIYHFRVTQRMSKKPLFKRNIRWNACRVSRGQKVIRIDLLAIATPESEPRVVAVFQFLPPPDFSGLMR